MNKPKKSDLPIYRNGRDAYRSLIQKANELKAAENDPAMLMVYCAVLDDMRSNFDKLGRILDRLELQH